jgi:AraC-like DNA-binding protein
LSLSVAAKAAGYDSPRTLTRHCLSHTGFAPHELRESAEEQVVAMRLANLLTKATATCDRS